MQILCGDIGGTNTRLALWDGHRLVSERVLASANWDGLDGPLDAWLRDTRAQADQAIFAVAGPVVRQRCTTTNLPWVVDARRLRARLGMPVRLLNDFEAAARGLDLLGEGDRVKLFGGLPARGAPRAVLGAGTGLGEAFVVGGRVVPGEGGHADFGPSDDRELELARWLQRRLGRASWEDVLSGRGLVHLARFLHERQGGPAPAWLDAADAPARVASEMPEALHWFCGLYGAEAGNHALRVLARGGVFLCGGIAPRIIDELRNGSFQDRFLAKGPVGNVLREVPVYVVTHPSLGLLGAAACGIRGGARDRQRRIRPS